MSNFASKQQNGFTIIELIIATTIFSIVLVMISTVLIQIGKMYYKAIAMSTTQQTVNAISNDVYRMVQFSSGGINSSSATDRPEKAYCIGDVRYTYVLDKPSGEGHVLWRDKVPSAGCVPVDFSQPLSEGKELLGARMRLLQFNILPLNGDSASRIQVAVAYGDSDLLTSYDQNGTERVDVNNDGVINDDDIASALCKNGPGSSYCAVSALSVVVKRRLN